MRKKLFWTVAVIIVAVISICVVKDQAIKSVITAQAARVVGAPVEIGSFSLGIFKQAVRIKGFKLHNPPGYPREVLLDVPEISVDYDLPALFKNKLHLAVVVVDIKELTLIKNKEGKLNVDALKVAQQKEKLPEQEAKKKPSGQMPMQIDVLTLTVGQVVYKDFSAGPTPSVRSFDAGIKEKTYKNITSAQQLVALVLTESMKATAIKGAGIYGAGALLGIGFLPAGVAGILMGENSARLEFDKDYDAVFDAVLRVAGEMGKIAREDKAAGVIKGTVSGSSVAIKIIKQNARTTQVVVSAKKMLIPKPQIAEGVLRRISETLR